MAAVAAPAMGPISDIIIGTVGDSLVVELGTHVGFELTTKVANDLVFDKTSNLLIPIHSARLQTTGVKMLLITLKYKHVVEDAALGFFRSSMHRCVHRGHFADHWLMCTVAGIRRCSRRSKTTSL